MRLEELLLRKEELPIVGENRFQIPIFPTLLSTDMLFDRRLAQRVFPKAAQEWFDDLSEYARCLEEGEKKQWLEETYLDKPMSVHINELGRQIVDPPGFWEDLVITHDNDFVSGFSISRNAGGSLYLGNEIDMQQFASPKLVRFNPEKLSMFAVAAEPSKIYGYSKHNVDYYQGALFLRNWAILYLNEAMRELEKKGNLNEKNGLSL